MDSAYASYYVHRDSVGDLSKCEADFPFIEEKAKEFYASRQIKGARLLIVKNQTEAEEKLIWCDYPSITDGRFPFLCCLIQPFDNSPVDIDELMAELNFISCAEKDPWGDE
jgi:hypothetical protein